MDHMQIGNHSIPVNILCMVEVKTVDTEKDLGVIIKCKLTFRDHSKVKLANAVKPVSSGHSQKDQNWFSRQII